MSTRLRLVAERERDLRTVRRMDAERTTWRDVLHVAFYGSIALGAAVAAVWWALYGWVAP